mmetsp:Transcript_3182/g.12270  ORF Transcript_3182/g.12270 Transcript_3182/m.12270 type:complete len:213 (+) Transcript_3182:123-761(+)
MMKRRRGETAPKSLTVSARAAAGEAKKSYAPSAAKCLNQSKMGPTPAFMRISGTNNGSVRVMETKVLPKPLKVTTSWRKGRKTSSPRRLITLKLIRMSRLMKSRFGRDPTSTLMHFWNNHAADNAGWYAFTVLRASRSRQSASNASSHAPVIREMWRKIAARPPKDNGDWMPLASPIAITRSNSVFSGESLYVGNNPNKTRLSLASSIESKP